ncbi:MAG: beta-ketoacyl synthase N-terminal-like domain-containing protein [Pseudomonadota bacterium]
MHESRCPVISGLGLCNGLGRDVPALIAALGEQRVAEYQPFFADEEEAARYGLPFNPLQVGLPAGSGGTGKAGRSDAQTAVVLLERVIDEALQHAGLDREVLSGQGVQLYIGGQGVQPQIMQYAAYLQRNDREDLQFDPSIRQLHSDSYAEEGLTRLLMQRFKLARPPLSLSTASCSSLSALYLASKAIEAGTATLAVVVSWQQVTLYNLLFMGGLNALARAVTQPFSTSSEGVMLGGAAAASILESPAHLAARGGRGRLRIEGFAVCQSGGSSRGGQSFSPDFRSISRTIGESLEKAGTTPEQIGCVFMHGNGIRGSDQAELMAVRKVWGDYAVPAVSYKAQFGYQIATSGLTDLAILDDAMAQRRLLAFNALAPLDQGVGVQLHADTGPVALVSDKVVKFALGIEGSVAACTLGRMS